MVTVTYLEMETLPPGSVAFPEGVTVARAYRPTVSFYRWLYETVGGPWQWVDRKRMSDDALEEEIQHDEVEVHVLYVEGTPAGYAELDLRPFPEIDLAYFGLMPQFMGRGLGKAFLRWTIEEAFARGPERLLVNTCDLDHPAALPNYEKAGFVVCARAQR